MAVGNVKVEVEKVELIVAIAQAREQARNAYSDARVECLREIVDRALEDTGLTATVEYDRVLIHGLPGHLSVDPDVVSRMLARGTFGAWLQALGSARE